MDKKTDSYIIRPDPADPRGGEDDGVGASGPGEGQPGTAVRGGEDGEAGVLEVDVPDKGPMHRVRIGPYGSPEEMNRARTQLSQHGVPATVVRTKD